MSTAARLDLALRLLRPSDWERFEQFASTFLSGVFPNLRTVAWPSGDKGRDAQLWSPEDDPSVMLQYSVTEDLKGKVRVTAADIRAEFAGASYLIYATSQSIDPKDLDPLSTEIRKAHRLALDVRDRRWFLEHCEDTPAAVRASQELAEQVVEPYLASNSVIESKGLALSDYESRVSFVYLRMQWKDDTREKGLTRVCFEALVRGVLRHSTSAARLHRKEIHQRIAKLLPGHAADELGRHIDAALKNLTKKHIRHWEKPDEFCLTHEETVRVGDALVEYEKDNARLEKEIDDAIVLAGKNLRVKLPQDLAGVRGRVRRLLEKVLLHRGEAFAETATHGSLQYALEVAEAYPINRRFAGFIDYKRVRWCATPFGLLPQVLLVDAKASTESNRETLQRSQLPMDADFESNDTAVKMKAGVPPHMDLACRPEGSLPAVTSSAFIHFYYEKLDSEPDPDLKGVKLESSARSQRYRRLRSIFAILLPHQRLKRRYNPTAAKTFFGQGKHSPKRNEVPRIRVYFTRLREMCPWRLQELQFTDGDDYSTPRWRDSDAKGGETEVNFKFMQR